MVVVVDVVVVFVNVLVVVLSVVLVFVLFHILIWSRGFQAFPNFYTVSVSVVVVQGVSQKSDL